MRPPLPALLILFCLNVSAQELVLISQDSSHTFLGCLTCSKYDSGSICNKYGDQGSKYGSNSIWNKYGDFGSKYSDKSPWNTYASIPPAIVDREGNFYGYFTSNKFLNDRTTIQLYAALTDAIDWVNDDLDRARDAVCEN